MAGELAGVGSEIQGPAYVRMPVLVTPKAGVASSQLAFNPNQMNALRPVMHLSAVRIADP